METKGQELASGLNTLSVILLIASIIGCAIFGGILFNSIYEEIAFLGVFTGIVCGIISGLFPFYILRALANIVVNVERSATAAEEIKKVISSSPTQENTKAKKSVPPISLKPVIYKTPIEKFEAQEQEMKNLQELLDNGDITKDEFERRKRIILDI